MRYSAELAPPLYVNGGLTQGLLVCAKPLLLRGVDPAMLKFDFSLAFAIRGFYIGALLLAVVKLPAVRLVKCGRSGALVAGRGLPWDACGIVLLGIWHRMRC